MHIHDLDLQCHVFWIVICVERVWREYFQLSKEIQQLYREWRIHLVFRDIAVRGIIWESSFKQARELVRIYSRRSWGSTLRSAKAKGVWMGCWQDPTIWIREKFLSSIKISDTILMFYDIYHFFHLWIYYSPWKMPYGVATFTVGGNKGCLKHNYSVIAFSITFAAGWWTSVIFVGITETISIWAFYKLNGTGCELCRSIFFLMGDTIQVCHRKF